MQYKCQECNDSGSRDKLGTYLDCNACGTAATRRDLNDFVKSLGPTHPEDVALAIHQRALAMAPKQEAPAPVMQDCSACLGSGWVSRDPDIGTEQECFSCDGSGKSDDAAPAAANGALMDDQINTIWESLPGLKIVAGRPIDHWNSLLRHEFARAILAAAGPYAALESDLTDAQLDELQKQSFNRNQSMKADTYAFGRACYRAALSGAKGN